ncbi:hypothetical protein MAR_031820, partial [Mya arenaria]
HIELTISSNSYYLIFFRLLCVVCYTYGIDQYLHRQYGKCTNRSKKSNESLQFTVKCLEEAMREPIMFVLGLQQMLSTVDTQKSLKQQLSDALAQNGTLKKTIEEHAAMQDAMENLQRQNETLTRRRKAINKTDGQNEAIKCINLGR